MENVDKQITLKVRNILENNCLASDNMLKREKYTCYTVPKTGFDGAYFKKIKEEFNKLGYEPEIQAEDKDFITYKLSDNTFKQTNKKNGTKF